MKIRTKGEAMEAARAAGVDMAGPSPAAEMLSRAALFALEQSKHQRPARKFVILSLGRAGTSHMIAMLRNTPGFYVHGEIFHEDVPTHILPEFPGDLSLRDQDPCAFVDAILEYQPPNCTAVGFKMWWNQNPTACEYVLSNEHIPKIIIDRPNRLAVYASNAKARSTGLWNTPEAIGGSYVEQRVPFDADEFREFALFVDRIFDAYRRLARGSVIEIKYEEILAKTAYAKFLGFLGLDAPAQEPTGYTKLNESNILLRFTGQDIPVVVEELQKMGRSEWAFENLQESTAP